MPSNRACTILALLVFVLALAGCGGGGDAPPPAAGTTVPGLPTPSGVSVVTAN